MSHENEEALTRLDVLEDLVNKINDINNSYSSLADKVKHLIDDIQSTEDAYMVDDLIGIYTGASKDTEEVKKLLADIESKRDEEESKQ